MIVEDQKLKLTLKFLFSEMLMSKADHVWNMTDDSAR